jgi:Protein of unknown function (DUF3305)
MSNLILPVAIVMERLALNNQWQRYRWEAQGVLPELSEERQPRILVKDESRLQLLFPGHRISLHPSEAENYYLNLSAPTPKVFVMWRLEDEIAAPVVVTVSYGEAARMMDSNEQVDGVAMPPDVADWVGDFVNRYYKPQPKAKIRRRDPLHEK